MVSVCVCLTVYIIGNILNDKTCQLCVDLSRAETGYFLHVVYN